MESLDKIELSLIELQKDFNEQINLINKDTKDFHNAIIKLSAKYPDHTELLQFIVFVNDKLEINQDIFRGIVQDGFNEIIKQKKEIVQQMKKHKIQSDKSGSLLDKIKSFKDLKIALVALAVIILGLSAIFAPTEMAALIKLVPFI